MESIDIDNLTVTHLQVEEVPDQVDDSARMISVLVNLAASSPLQANPKYAIDTFAEKKTTRSGSTLGFLMSLSGL